MMRHTIEILVEDDAPAEYFEGLFDAWGEYCGTFHAEDAPCFVASLTSTSILVDWCPNCMTEPIDLDDNPDKCEICHGELTVRR